MKTIILTFFVLTNCLLSIGQDISTLDKKNGFKTIKFGSTVESFLKLKHHSYDEVKKTDIYLYEPSDSDLLNVFDKTFDKIYLYFDSNKKLVAFYLSKEYSSSIDDFYGKCLDDLLSIMTDYVSQIGKGMYDVKVSNENVTTSGLGWESDDIKLETRSNYYGFNSDAELQVFYYSKEYLKKLANDGF
jgi:hypothetical protein